MSRVDRCTTGACVGLGLQPHLAYKLSAGFKVGLSTGGEGSTTLAKITATLTGLKNAELATYSKYGKLAGTKSAVQSAVMWQTVWNPLEQGPFAYVRWRFISVPSL